MLAGKIIDKIESFAPTHLACGWDNPGLLVGSKNAEVSKVLLALDINIKTAQEAISKGCQMIVSHHPLFLSGIKKVDFDTPDGALIKLLIENNITAFAAHTNMDAAEGGINQTLAKMFELSDIGILEPTADGLGIGRYGNLPEEITADELADKVLARLNTPFLRISGKRNVKRLAICSGGGGDYVRYAKENNCDCLLTGDVKYHHALDGRDLGICVIDAGHFPTEKLVCEIFKDILADEPIELIISDDKDIFEIFVH